MLFHYVQTETELLWLLDDRTEQIIRNSPIERFKFGLMHEGIDRLRLGSSPILMLSGGVDSQCVALLLKQHGVKFKCVTLDYLGYNKMDVDHAITFCKIQNIPHEVLTIDVLTVLSRELVRLCQQYKCPSPQFCTHFYGIEQIYNKFAPTSILCGGTALYMEAGQIVYHLTVAQNSWNNIKLPNCLVYGNVLGHCAEISIPLFLNTPSRTNPYVIGDGARYHDKIQGMWALGIGVLPQHQKYTGFETLKELFEHETGEGWAFEQMFRYPLQQMVPDLPGRLVLSPDIEMKLKQMYRTNHENFNFGA